ncbi:hypothetical protein [Nostoc sp.]|uniref:hypothetical protein n=1 Tax=Nostoc sp. TaxID=1180 RepID=UPI002FF5B61E
MADFVGEYCSSELVECVSLINRVSVRSPYTLSHCQVTMRRAHLGFVLIAPLFSWMSAKCDRTFS